MTLPDLRAKIDGLDAQLMRLLSQRFAATQAICAHKQQTGAPILDPQREAQIQARIQACPKPEQVRAVYARIFEITRG